MKVLYLVATTRRPNRENLTGRISNWKQALNMLTPSEYENQHQQQKIAA